MLHTQLVVHDCYKGDITFFCLFQEKSPADCCKWKIVPTTDVFRQTPYNSPDNGFMLQYYGSNRPSDPDLFFAISREYDQYQYQLKSKSSAASFSFVYSDWAVLCVAVLF